MPGENQINSGTVLRSSMFSIILTSTMCLLPYEPSVATAVARLTIWCCFLRFAVGTQVLWNPGPTSWFVVFSFLSYGTWPFFFLTGTLFYSGTDSFRAVCGLSPEIGFEVDTYIFCFVSTSWIILCVCYRNLLNQQVFSLQKERQINKSFNTQRNNLFLLFVAGGICSTPGIHSIGRLAQPILLIAQLQPIASAMLVFTPGTEKQKRSLLLLTIIMTIGLGFIGFLFSGSKGLIFISLFTIAWLYGSVYPVSRWTVLGLFSFIAVVFLLTLPVLQRGKDKYLMTSSPTAALGEVVSAIQDLSNGELGLQRGKGVMLGMWEYMGYRLCTASMSHTYYRQFESAPRGTESIMVSAAGVVPRLINPDKVSSNAYYNELARTSGVGGYHDYNTSRKPTFVDESIICWGRDGCWIGGCIFGLYLVVVERICYACANEDAFRRAIRFAAIPVAQIPYFAVIFGSVPFSLLFLWLVGMKILPTLYADREKESQILTRGTTPIC